MGLETQHQYENYSRHRLHFSNLFFSVIAFCGICSIALCFILGKFPEQSLLLNITIGLGQIICGIISWRLLARETYYTKLMIDIEALENTKIRLNENDKFSARKLVVFCIFICGFAMMIKPYLL